MFWIDHAAGDREPFAKKLSRIFGIVFSGIAKSGDCRAAPFFAHLRPDRGVLDLSGVANGDRKVDGIGKDVLCRRRIVGAFLGAAPVGMALAVFALDRRIRDRQGDAELLFEEPDRFYETSPHIGLAATRAGQVRDRS